ncbi:MAG: hypothetical protein Kow0069_31340 [Promethearchaeota archaeon]
MEEGGERRGYVYRQMELPAARISPEFEAQVRKRIHPHVRVVPATLEDDERVASLHNHAFLTATDPYAPIRAEDVRHLLLCPRTLVLVGMIWGAQDCGFIVLTFDEHCSDEEVLSAERAAKEGGEVNQPPGPEAGHEVGFISGLGVLPQWQRRGVGTTLGVKSWEFFKSAGVQTLRCEVFLGNDASYALIRAMGFDETGRTIYWDDGNFQQLRRL